MLDMLTPLIIEADTVSSKLIEIILWQIIDPKKVFTILILIKLLLFKMKMMTSTPPQYECID